MTDDVHVSTVMSAYEKFACPACGVELVSGGRELGALALLERLRVCGWRPRVTGQEFGSKWIAIAAPPGGDTFWANGATAADAIQALGVQIMETLGELPKEPA